MAQYHLTPTTGLPGRCEDVTHCPVGVPEAEHYASREEAFEAYEARGPVPPEARPAPTGESYAPGDIRVTRLSPAVLLSPDTALLPAGRYWFGDPGYAVGQDDAAWQEWVRIAGETSHDFKDPIAGANYNEYPVVSASTLYGDGGYQGSDGVEYSVDSGCLAPVPAELIEKMGLDKAALDGFGSWLDLAEATKLTRDPDGLITFGSLTIPTGDEAEEAYL